MAAYRQAKRMQRGVKLGYGDTTGIYASTTSIKRLLSDPIPIGTSDFSIEYYGNAYGSGTISSPLLYNKASNGLISSHQYLQVYGLTFGENNLNWVIFGIPNGGSINDDSLNFSYSASTLDEKFHLVITRSGKAIHVYIDNVLIASKEQTEVKDLGDLQLAIANSSDVGFVRVWNMCLSTDDVTAHYNNGDPMGYVVPKAMRAINVPFPTGLYTESSNVFFTNSGSITRQEFHIPQGNGFSGQFMRFSKITALSIYCQYWLIYLNKQRSIKLNIEYRSSVAFSISNKGQKVNYAANTGDALTTSISYYAGETNPLDFEDADDSWAEIRVLSIEPIGLLAEYLPQNLMESRKGPEVEPKAKIYEFNTGDEYYKSVISGVKYPFDCIYRVDYVVNEWDYQPKLYGSVGFLGISGATILTPDSQDWNTLEKAKVGEPRYLLIKMPGAGNPALYVYGGNDNDVATARHLKVTIKGVTPVSIPLSWLDSAKQLPLSDEYMEPLFQSIGGYDMAANGAPEILYNE